MATNPNYVEVKYLYPHTHRVDLHDAVMIEGNVAFIEFTLVNVPQGGIKLISSDGLTKQYMFVTHGTNAVSATGPQNGKTTAGATAPLQVHRGANALVGAENLKAAIELAGKGHGTTGGDPRFRVSVFNSAGASGLGNRGVMRIHQAVAGERGQTAVVFDGGFGPTADTHPTTTAMKFAPEHIQNTENHIVGGDNAFAELLTWGADIRRGGNGRPFTGGTGPTIVISGQTFGSGGLGLSNNREIVTMQIRGLGDVKGFNVYGLKS